MGFSRWIKNQDTVKSVLLITAIVIITAMALISRRPEQAITGFAVHEGIIAEGNLSVGTDSGFIYRLREDCSREVLSPGNTSLRNSSQHLIYRNTSDGSIKNEGLFSHDSLSENGGVYAKSCTSSCFVINITARSAEGGIEETRLVSVKPACPEARIIHYDVRFDSRGNVSYPFGRVITSAQTGYVVYPFDDLYAPVIAETSQYAGVKLLVGTNATAAALNITTSGFAIVNAKVNPAGQYIESDDTHLTEFINAGENMNYSSYYAWFSQNQDFKPKSFVNTSIYPAQFYGEALKEEFESLGITPDLANVGFDAEQKVVRLNAQTWYDEDMGAFGNDSVIVKNGSLENSTFSHWGGSYFTFNINLAHENALLFWWNRYVNRSHFKPVNWSLSEYGVGGHFADMSSNARTGSYSLIMNSTNSSDMQWVIAQKSLGGMNSGDNVSISCWTTLLRNCTTCSQCGLLLNLLRYKASGSWQEMGSDVKPSSDPLGEWVRHETNYTLPADATDTMMKHIICATDGSFLVDDCTVKRNGVVISSDSFEEWYSSDTMLYRNGFDDMEDVRRDFSKELENRTRMSTLDGFMRTLELLDAHNISSIINQWTPRIHLNKFADMLCYENPTTSPFRAASSPDDGWTAVRDATAIERQRRLSIVAESLRHFVNPGRILMISMESYEAWDTIYPISSAAARQYSAIASHSLTTRNFAADRNDSYIIARMQINNAFLPTINGSGFFINSSEGSFPFAYRLWIVADEEAIVYTDADMFSLDSSEVSPVTGGQIAVSQGRHLIELFKGSLLLRNRTGIRLVLGWKSSAGYLVEGIANQTHPSLNFNQALWALDMNTSRIIGRGSISEDAVPGERRQFLFFNLTRVVINSSSNASLYSGSLLVANTSQLWVTSISEAEKHVKSNFSVAINATLLLLVPSCSISAVNFTSHSGLISSPGYSCNNNTGLLEVNLSGIEPSESSNVLVITYGSGYCYEPWECTAWGACLNSIQTRSCTCLCGDSSCYGDHTTSRSCSEPQQAATGGGSGGMGINTSSIEGAGAAGADDGVPSEDNESREAVSESPGAHFSSEEYERAGMLYESPLAGDAFYHKTQGEEASGVSVPRYPITAKSVNALLMILALFCAASYHEIPGRTK